MTFESALQQAVEKSSETRFELNTYHWPKLSAIQNVMAQVFGIPLSFVKNLHQAYYYRNGGYPSENSPPRYDPPARKAAEMYIMLSMIGKEGYIENIFKEYGITISFDTQPEMNFDLRGVEDDFSKHLEKSEMDINFNGPLSDEEIFDYFLEAMTEVQADICNMADSIKIDAFEKIDKQFPKKLKKNKFLNVVKIKAAQKQSEEKAEKQKGETVHYNDMENHSLDVVI
jgi:hypothetical protein